MKTLNKCKTNQKANSILYFLANSFIFKHFFHIDLVGEYESKDGIDLTLNSISFMWSFSKKALYFFVLGFIFKIHPEATLMFLILIEIIVTLFTNIFKYNKNDYDAIMLLKVNPKNYAKYLLNTFVTKYLFFSIACISVLAAQTKINYLLCIFWTLILVSIRLIGQTISILIIENKNFELADKKTGHFLIILAVLALSSFFFITKVYFTNSVMNIIGILIVIVGLVCYYYLTQYDSYTVLFKLNLNTNTIKRMKLSKSTIIEGVDYAKTYKSLDKSAKTNSFTGYKYMYQLFLERYHKILRNRVVLFTIIFAILGLVLVLLPLIPTMDNKEYLDFIYVKFTSLFFVLYIITSSIGKRLIQLCFFQIDRYLINYSFFRTKEAIMTNLWLRMKTIIVENIIPTVVFSLLLALTFIIYGQPIEPAKVIVAFFLPLILAIFFSMYHMTMYYLLQPHSFEGTVVNKTYPIIDKIIYLIVYFLYITDVEFSVLTLLIISFIFIVISVVLFTLVTKKAPKEFRVR